MIKQDLVNNNNNIMKIYITRSNDKGVDEGEVFRLTNAFRRLLRVRLKLVICVTDDI